MKKSARSQSKYPGLQIRFTLPHRREFVETEYVNGVYSESGEMLIRPLTDEEKDFLNRFYEETVHANFKHPGELLIADDNERKFYNNQNYARRMCCFNRAKYTKLLYELSYQSDADYATKKQITQTPIRDEQTDTEIQIEDHQCSIQNNQDEINLEIDKINFYLKYRDTIKPKQWKEYFPDESLQSFISRHIWEE